MRFINQNSAISIIKVVLKAAMRILPVCMESGTLHSRQHKTFNLFSLRQQIFFTIRFYRQTKDQDGLYVRRKSHGKKAQIKGTESHHTSCNGITCRRRRLCRLSEVHRDKGGGTIGPVRYGVDIGSCREDGPGDKGNDRLNGGRIRDAFGRRFGGRHDSDRYHDRSGAG